MENQINGSNILKETQEMINNISENLNTLTMNDISVYMIKLSANLSTLGEYLINAEQDYYNLWENLRKELGTDGRTNKKSKTTKEYFLMRLYEVNWKQQKK